MITALYDGRCILCQTILRIAQAIDWFKRVEFLDLHNKAEVETRFPDLNHAAMMGEIHVVANGKLFVGFDGLRRILREMPIGFFFWAIFSLPGMGWLGPHVYRFIANNRYSINRLLGVDLTADDDCIDGVCKLPTAR